MRTAATPSATTCSRSAAPRPAGVYVSPTAGRRHPPRPTGSASPARAPASTDDLSVGGVSDPRELVARLWPLDDLAAAYRSFIATYEGVPAQLEAMRRRGERISEHEFLPGVLHLAIRFNSCFEADPLLPPELLPRPWPGKDARELLARCRKLGVLAREDKDGPALYRVFDDAIAHLP
jgi:phenylacetic acid degradation operon negative regulatory protein